MKHLSKTDLLAQTKNLVAQERKITNELISHLEEIQTRRIHAELGYSSMWEFATQYLGMSEGAAQRRISAMRLAQVVPEAKEALESGKLSLSNAAKVQNFIQAEKKAGRVVNAAEIVEKVNSRSQQECDAILFSISPFALPKEKLRIVTAEGDIEIRVVLTHEVHEKLNQLKGLVAHAMPNATLAELIEYMLTQTIDTVEKKKAISPKAGKIRITAAAKVLENISEAITERPSLKSVHAPLPNGKRVYLPIKLRHAVWRRSGGKCEYRSAEGKDCASKYQLEIDHAIPLALNGSNELGNLRILCKSHNLQQAQEKLRRYSR